MASGRLLNKSIVLSRKINQVSEGAENLYYRLLVMSDDFGCYHADPEIIKGTIYTLRKTSLSLIEARLRELDTIKLIKIYKVNGEIYLQIEKFEENQKFRSDIKRKSDFPQSQQGSRIESERIRTSLNAHNSLVNRNRNRNRNKNRNKNAIKVQIVSPVDEVINQWNVFARKNDLAEIHGIEKGSVRERSLEARMRSKDFNFPNLLVVIQNSPFLLGQNEKGFTCSFDWIIKSANYQKIIEGNYLDRKKEVKFQGIQKWLEERRGDIDEGE